MRSLCLIRAQRVQSSVSVYFDESKNNFFITTALLLFRFFFTFALFFSLLKLFHSFDFVFFPLVFYFVILKWISFGSLSHFSPLFSLRSSICISLTFDCLCVSSCLWEMFCDPLAFFCYFYFQNGGFIACTRSGQTSEAYINIITIPEIINRKTKMIGTTQRRRWWRRRRARKHEWTTIKWTLMSYSWFDGNDGDSVVCWWCVFFLFILISVRCVCVFFFRSRLFLVDSCRSMYCKMLAILFHWFNDYDETTRE